MIQSNITAIIPVHEYNEEVEKYLGFCLESIFRQEKASFDKVFVVAPKDIFDNITVFVNSKNKGVEVLLNEGKPSYQSQIMLGVDFVTTNYFTIIEFDDEISSKYLLNMVKYLASDDDTDVFLPVILEVNSENKKVKETNIVAWSKQLVGENGEIGFLNKDLLLSYSDFKVSGSVIKKDNFLKIKGFKENIVFSFGLEFLLRGINNGLKMFVVPKILYKHVTDRKGSMTDYYLNNLTKKEIRFWFDKAISESDYFMDREIINE